METRNRKRRKWERGEKMFACVLRDGEREDGERTKRERERESAVLWPRWLN